MRATFLLNRFSNVGRPFRHRNYRLFFGGQLVSLIGTWMQNLAQAWLVYRLTGSAEMLGLIAFAQHAPVFLFATMCGAVADRFDRHRILLLTQVSSMVCAAILAVLTLTESVQAWEVFVLASLLGTAHAFDIPARQSFVVEMVGREDLPNTIALNSSMFNGARLVGPAIAGVVVATVGEGWCFLLNAVSYLFVLAALLAMRRERVVREPSGRRIFADIREGIAFVAGHRPIRSVMLLLADSSMTGTAMPTLMPIFADEILKGGATALGTLMSAVGLGALLGGLLLASRGGRRGLANWIAFGSLCFGVSLMLFSYCPWYVPSVVLAVISGFALIVQLISSNTLIQSIVPDQYRGRTMAIYSMMFMGMAPFGALIAGFAAERVGASATLLVCGVFCILGGGIFRYFLPGMRAAQDEWEATKRAEAGTESETVP